MLMTKRTTLRIIPIKKPFLTMKEARLFCQRYKVTAYFYQCSNFVRKTHIKIKNRVIKLTIFQSTNMKEKKKKKVF